jgi:hydroxymethylpyrimidine/phosphomethylpyrimidine kinase
MVHAQIQAVLEAFPPDAIKLGMLYSSSIIRAVAEVLPAARATPLVLDPVMISTSGASLLQPAAVKALQQLFPRATLLTPNLDEASALLKRRLSVVEDLRSAARELHDRFGCAALVKGGHLRGLQSAVDIYYDGSTELLLEAPFFRRISTHGTGCTYASAIAAFLARGEDLADAVSEAKNYITQAIASSDRVGRHDVLGFFSKA